MDKKGETVMKWMIWYDCGNGAEYEEVEFDEEYEAEDYAWERFKEEAEPDNYCGVVDLEK